MISTHENNNGISIIVPTYMEADNLPELITRIAQAEIKFPLEVLIMDDNSPDDTQEVLEKLSSQYSWLRYIVRTENRGLSQSILAGCRAAKNPILVIMDADLSHPPEKIPQLVAVLCDENADLVLGSRYVAGGSIDANWSWYRYAASRGAALLARILVPLKDPLAGFIVVKKTRIAAANNLQPASWKIGLEIMIKCQCKKIIEVPIHFCDRKRGKSKLNLKESKNYFMHVLRLVIYRWKR